jgi:uncharacterized protein (TIGR02118 family)
MHKVVFFLRYRDDADLGEAQRRFAAEHSRLVLAVPGVVRYVQNPVVTSATLAGVAGERPAADTYAAIWFADRDAYVAAIESPQWQRAAEDAAEIFDMDRLAEGWAAEIEERVKREGLGAAGDGVSTPPSGPVKLVGILRYRTDISREDCNAYWATTHGDIALSIKQLSHYVQNHAIRPIGSETLAFDGFSEAWMADQDAYEQGMASAEWNHLGEDGDNLFDMSLFKSIIVDELVERG